MWNISEDDLSTAVIIGIIFAIIGARLYYVTFNWDIYSKTPSEIFKTWHGGMAIHGVFWEHYYLYTFILN